MSRATAPDAAGRSSGWAPPLASLRLVGDGRSAALLSPDASVLWWCAPEFDDQPLCWRLLDATGGSARFPELRHVDADDAPAGASATTVLRDAVGLIDVRDGIVTRGDGVALVRLLRRRPGRGPTHAAVGTVLSLINQADLIVAGAAGEGVALKVVANYAIPFLTSSTGALLAVRERPVDRGATSGA